MSFALVSFLLSILSHVLRSRFVFLLIVSFSLSWDLSFHVAHSPGILWSCSFHCLLMFFYLHPVQRKWNDLTKNPDTVIYSFLLRTPIKAGPPPNTLLDQRNRPPRAQSSHHQTGSWCRVGCLRPHEFIPRQSTRVLQCEHPSLSVHFVAHALNAWKATQVGDLQKVRIPQLHCPTNNISDHSALHGKHLPQVVILITATGRCFKQMKEIAQQGVWVEHRQFDNCLERSFKWYSSVSIRSCKASRCKVVAQSVVIKSPNAPDRNDQGIWLWFRSPQ